MYLKCNRINGLLECKTEKLKSQWSKQEACFAHVTQVWLSVNHNTSVTLPEGGPTLTFFVLFLDEGVQIPLKTSFHWLFLWHANDGPTLKAL